MAITTMPAKESHRAELLDKDYENNNGDDKTNHTNKKDA
jgi:hypothetical protein